MDNLEIRVFTESVKKLVYENTLPFELKRIVLVEILREVTAEAENKILEEINAKNMKESEK